MKFTKMQGIGNDYVYVNGFSETIRNPADLARKISDRHFGVGSDGLVLILPGEQTEFRMRMFNADGSEAEMCGNASRCVGKYLYERGLTDRTEISLETGAGIKILHLTINDGLVSSVRVDMGEPCLISREIDPQLNGRVNAPLTVNGRVFYVTCVNTGNPHCVAFLENVESWPVEIWGPCFENHPAFPQRTNTEFVQVVDRTHLRMRVWERGAGETMACGTGACASLVAAALCGHSERKSELILNGGILEIEWDQKTGHVFMSGPAEFVFDGEWKEQ